MAIPRVAAVNGRESSCLCRYMLVLPLVFQDTHRATLWQEWEGKAIIIAFEITSQEALIEKNSKHKLQAPDTDSPREHH